MFRSLDHLRIFLGVPLYRSATGGECDSRVSAHWDCGCIASGASFAKLHLKTCNSHRAGRIELEPVAT
jgi:hypothetical protein